MLCPDCPGSTKVYLTDSSFRSHWGKVHGPLAKAKRGRFDDELHEIKRRHRADSERQIMAEKAREESEELVKAFGNQLVATLVYHDGDLKDRYGLSQAARTFVKDTLLDQMLGVQRRCVQELLAAKISTWTRRGHDFLVLARVH